LNPYWSFDARQVALTHDETSAKAREHKKSRVFSGDLPIRNLAKCLVALVLSVVLLLSIASAAVVGPNDVPTINQRTALPEYGTNNTITGNNQGGGPSAGASLIAGASHNGHTSPGPLDKDAAALALAAMTKGPGPEPGTFDQNLTDAIASSLNQVYGNLYTVEFHFKPSKDLVLNSLNNGRYVVALLKWGDNGHFVAIQQMNDVANADGSNDVTLMDPWFGMNFQDTLKANSNGFLGVSMTGEAVAQPSGGWGTAFVQSIIVVSNISGNYPFPSGSSVVQSAQVTISGAFTFVITGRITGDVMINDGTVSGTTGTLYLVQGAPAFGLDNGTVVVPPQGTLTPVGQLNSSFNPWFVRTGPRLYTFVWPVTTGAIGGSLIPLNALLLLAPYVGLASMISVVAAATVVLARRSRRGSAKNGTSTP